MTPLVGIIIAVLAGLLAPNVRGVAVSVLAPMVAATAVQTWDLGSGMGSNPANTIDQASYWVVQLIIVSIITGLAFGIYRLRLRRATRRGESAQRPALAGRRATLVLGTGVVAMTVVLTAGAVLVNSLHRHHGVGAGTIPWTGVLGIVVGLGLTVGLMVALVIGSRSDRRARVGA